MIEKTEKYVENALRNRPHTREDDNLLYVDVIRQINPALVNVNFLMTFESARKKKLPAYETISRCRRKLQEKYPEKFLTNSEIWCIINLHHTSNDL